MSPIILSIQCMGQILNAQAQNQYLKYQTKDNQKKSNKKKYIQIRFFKNTVNKLYRNKNI